MIRPTEDVGLIGKILGKPLTTLPERTVFLLLETEQKINGLVILYAWDDFLGILDVFLLKKYREDKELHKSLSEEVLQFCFSLGFGKLVSFVPDSAPVTMAFFQRGGMKREGVLKDSCVIDSTVMNQTIIGVNKANRS